MMKNIKRTLVCDLYLLNTLGFILTFSRNKAFPEGWDIEGQRPKDPCPHQQSNPVPNAPAAATAEASLQPKHPTAVDRLWPILGHSFFLSRLSEFR